jgi:hypothetical protein
VSRPEIVAIIAHDAGGAEILASYIAQNNLECRFVLDGPAKNIFSRRFGAIELFTLEKAIAISDWCLCGTGWQTDLEWSAIEHGGKAGKKVIAFLDHWVNYKERFIRNERHLCPDEIWVGDRYAEKVANENFPDIIIKCVTNPYFIDIKKQIAQLKNKNNIVKGTHNNILYVSENISAHALLRYGDERYFGYTEKDALNYFLENINLLGYAESEIKIRPHPSENPNKFEWVKQFDNISIKIGGYKTLIEEITESDVIVGCESMAMVVGLLADKRVISSIPLDGKKCSLPQKEIEHLQALL